MIIMIITRIMIIMIIIIIMSPQACGDTPGLVTEPTAGLRVSGSVDPIRPPEL